MKYDQILNSKIMCKSLLYDDELNKKGGVVQIGSKNQEAFDNVKCHITIIYIYIYMCVVC
jgi:hypothetical protein